ncbi:ribosomal protein L1 [Plenodomus tracheiphilus IPT5]|uniref:Ribosomal protein L1 n=1 Tax=Plenodomus tracheiphilus IPT5 TaxID=1408161 RepID=A0A6A7B5M2_9PLEO|nr:ribosomal protein L1 [Plenodomus tracheiphilus IPT5]
MAKSKTLTKKVQKPVEAPLTTKVVDGTPYQLDPAQVERAAKALVAHMKKHVSEKEEAAPVKNLAEDEDEPEANDDPIFLSISTKKHIHDTNRLKPNKIPLPHPIIAENVRICIFTKDPQRTYKDLVASDAFPAALRTNVQRVLGVEKLKKRYKSYEQKRALAAEYDFFLVDDRIIKIVADFLGKSFYGTKTKRPIPIRLTAGAHIDKSGKKDTKEPVNAVGTAQGIAKEIETALKSTYLSLSASANSTIKIGLLSMTPEQLTENISAVVDAVVPKQIEHGWRNVRALHIKGPQTKALPVWLADELWVDETQVLDGPHRAAITDSAKAESAQRKRKFDEWEEELLDEEELAAKKAHRDAKKSKKSTKKSSISKEKRLAMKKDALESVQTPLIAS